MQLANKVWNRIRDTHQERGYVCCTIILVVDLNPNVKIFRTVFGTHGNQKDFFLNGIYCLYVCVWILYTIDYNGSSGDLWVILPENRPSSVIHPHLGDLWWSLWYVFVLGDFCWCLLDNSPGLSANPWRYCCCFLVILLVIFVQLVWHGLRENRTSKNQHHTISSVSSQWIIGAQLLPLSNSGISGDFGVCTMNGILKEDPGPKWLDRS